ncbi:hypothetical protein F4804DRAFT_50275 [Jackrogersella minutella]|nr:hypothetical protein F4804DRAFT_50275 [Jackrogersella minutella]
MDDDSIDIGAWRRAHLGEEPIYCAAPPPQNSDDIICLGSDDELDDDAKIAKRLRYEKQGLRYLQGKPVRIMTASLHGPFDKASGWENPWLPKQPAAVKKSVLKPSRPIPPKPLPAIKQRFLRDIQDHITPRFNSSIHCHLPSPESNRESQLSREPSETDTRSRIQAWARDVSQGTALGRDPFWAPDEAPPKEIDEPGRKRPATKEWLRKKPSKRKKLNISHTMVTASTPTPIVPGQTSMRSSSVPTNIEKIKQSIIPRKIASQSFELATPSSTANQSGSEAPYRGQFKASKNHWNMSSHIKPSENSEIASESSKVRSVSMITDSIHSQPPAVGDGEREGASNAKASNDSNQVPEVVTNEARQGQEINKEMSFDSHSDQSFHYRPRPREETAEPNGSISSPYPEPAETITHDSPIYEYAKAVAVQAIERLTQLPRHSLISEQPVHVEPVATSQQSENIADRICEQKKDINIANTKEHYPIFSPLKEAVEIHKLEGSEDGLSRSCPSKDQKLTAEIVSPPLIHSVGVSSSVGITNALIENKAIENEGPSPIHDIPYLSQVILMEMMAQSATFSNKATESKGHLAGSGATVDEESTLLDDPMEVDESALHETNKPPTSHHVPSSRDSKALLVAELDKSMQVLIKKAVQEDGSETESNLVMVQSSRREWAVAEDEPGGVAVDEENIVAVKVEEVLKTPHLEQTTLLESPEIVSRQSPWVSDLPPGADLTIAYIKTEPIEDRPSHSPCPPHSTMLGCQANGHGIPEVRLSQQSPWSGGLLGPARLEKEQHPTTSSESGPVNMPLLAATSEGHQSPAAGSNTSILPCLKLQPLRIAAPGSGSRSPEHSDHGPTTPPRMSTSHVRTPDLEKSIKSFAMFNTPSPKRPSRQSIKQGSSAGRPRGILSSAPYSNPWTSRRSSRRVSFAVLPGGDDINNSPSHNTTRAASPPPQTTADIQDEDVGNTFHNHFDAMKRRTSGVNVRLRPQPRLLPSFSQQMSTSPTVCAMAEAFQGADALIARADSNLPEDVGGDADQEMPDGDQSPWRKESQGVDDVADVMNNLDQFLNAWDIDTELQKGVKEKPGKRSQDWDMIA